MNHSKFQVPQFWWLLNEQDCYGYQNLRLKIISLNHNLSRDQKNSFDVFQQILGMIQNFVMRGDNFDTRRGLVCGIYWLKDSLLINNHQFQCLVMKCKSSINGSLQKITYISCASRMDSSSMVVKVFPILLEYKNEIRKWTMRRWIVKNDGYPGLSNQNSNVHRSLLPDIRTLDEKIENRHNAIVNIQPFQKDDVVKELSIVSLLNHPIIC